MYRLKKPVSAMVMRRTETVDGRACPGVVGMVCMRLKQCESTARMRGGHTTAGDATTHTFVRSSGCVHAAATAQQHRSAARWR